MHFKRPSEHDTFLYDSVPIRVYSSHLDRLSVAVAFDCSPRGSQHLISLVWLKEM